MNVMESCIPKDILPKRKIFPGFQRTYNGQCRRGTTYTEGPSCLGVHGFGTSLEQGHNYDVKF